MNAQPTTILDYLTSIDRIRAAAEDLISKGCTAVELEQAILDEGIALLPEVHAILVEIENEYRSRP